VIVCSGRQTFSFNHLYNRPNFCLQHTLQSNVVTEQGNRRTWCSSCIRRN